MTEILTLKELEGIVYSILAESPENDGLSACNLRREAAILLKRACKIEETTLITHPEMQLEEETWQRAVDWAQRRVKGEPMSYIVGERDFYGRTFKVGPGVLIPRPETELLVDWALQAGGARDCRLLDLCSGSGCVVLSVKAERPRWQVEATELSEVACHYFEINAQNLGLSEVVCHKGDLFADVQGNFDLIVANPPYIAEGDPDVAEDVASYEPKMALFAGQDGLQVIKRIVARAGDYLRPNGWVAMEIGFRQAESVIELLQKANFSRSGLIKDFSGLDRIVWAFK